MEGITPLSPTPRLRHHSLSITARIPTTSKVVAITRLHPSQDRTTPDTVHHSLPLIRDTVPLKPMALLLVHIRDTHRLPDQHLQGMALRRRREGMASRSMPPLATLPLANNNMLLDGSSIPAKDLDTKLDDVTAD